MRSSKKTTHFFAEERRKQNRIVQNAAIQSNVEKELNEYFSKQNFQNNQNLESYYSVIYEFIDHKASSIAWKKHAHQFFRNYIQSLNSERTEPFALPYLTFTMERDNLVRDGEWFKHGYFIDSIIEKLSDYWILTRDSTFFSDEEIIGNILLSSILFAGLNHKASLEALLEYLKNPTEIRHIEDINIIFLQPISSNYGDLRFVDNAFRKSRNFIPDHITRLWLIHFNLRKPVVAYDPEFYLDIIFKKIKSNFSHPIYNILLSYANFNWTQLPSVDIDPALSQCLIENILTCGLSKTEFENYYQPKFQTESHKAWDHSQPQPRSIKIGTEFDELENVIKIHKDLLKIIRTEKTEHKIEQLIINYVSNNLEKFNPFSQRIILWLISLYKPSNIDVEKILKYFNVVPKLFEKTFVHHNMLADSSIYTYYTRIAEPWLTHSLQYFEEDDINSVINKIYEQIISHTSTLDEKKPALKKSTAQVVATLKRFHTFQQILFHAEEFEMESIKAQTYPKARIIGYQTYNIILKKLELRYLNNFIEEDHYHILKLIYILAFRTGMRLNEILGLRVRDIEGIDQFSIWVQPYGSKKKGNLHQLKTDSAERILPIYCLLKPDEYDLFHSFIVKRRLLNRSDLYLFNLWNVDRKLKKHFVTVPFKEIIDDLFEQHDYSFHSFRHTAANNFALLLNSEYFPLVEKLTDYSQEEYSKIRKTLLRQEHGQNHWFVVAHLLGHIDPSETFKSYIHLSYLIAGQKLLKYSHAIETALVCKIVGYELDPSLFHFIENPESDRVFNFQRHSAHFCQLLLNEQKSWNHSNTQGIGNSLRIPKARLHNFFNYFAGTQESKVSFQIFYKALKELEIDKDTRRVAAELNLPDDLIQYWFNNAIHLKNLTSNKGTPRLFIPKNDNHLIPTQVDTSEEKEILIFFLKNLQKEYEKNPDQIRMSLEIFLERTTISHSGIHYPKAKIDQLELFFATIKKLFPSQYWALVGNDLDQILNSKQHPELHNLLKSKKLQRATTKDNYVRLQLFSEQQGKALGVFKFCLHMACVGTPTVPPLNIQTEN